jgi:hypothetical protein
MLKVVGVCLLLEKWRDQLLGPKLSSGFLAVLRPAFCKKYWFAERRTQNSQFRDYRFCSVLVSCILPTFENELLAQNAD